MKREGFICVVFAAILGTVIASAGQATPGGQKPASPPAKPAANDAAVIKSAMTAAPPAVATNATIIDLTADGKVRTVRKGTNAFSCMADNPETPGPDPMCADQNAMAWVDAWINKKEPPANKVGFMYMLAGGTDASNTDPYAQKPAPTNNWINTGPHIMIVGAKGMMEGYPRDPKPDTAKPYVMWAGTPYEHLMVPIK